MNTNRQAERKTDRQAGLQRDWEIAMFKTSQHAPLYAYWSV